ncbi:MAG: 4Fe-4S dicluster domain-containing protein [Planctomycetota bacterium]|nr:MAG: 4Fe-4S dicluster domain-containing protein [Planctomycetota bacterium]
MNSLTNDPPLYWRSIEELEKTPEFVQFLHREFPQAASEFPAGMSRRRWLQLMGASLAMAGVAGCRWEKETIAPFAVRPANRIPGVPQKFATSIELGGSLRPLIVTAYDGRPIKVEGHREHPASLGGTDSFSQAALLHLYDPDRSREILQLDAKNQRARTWDDFADFMSDLGPRLRASGGKGVRLLVERSSSLCRARLLANLAGQWPQAKLIEYEAYSRNHEQLGTKQAFGQAYKCVYDLERANVILALDSDLFDFHPQAVSLIRAWSNRRVPESGEMNRVYAVESQFSTIGSIADHRVPLRSSDIPLLLNKLQVRIEARVSTPDLIIQTDYAEPMDRFLEILAADLVANLSRSLIVVGPGQPPEVHASVHQLNQLLGNVGETVSFIADPPTDFPHESMEGLIEEIERGEVNVLITLGGNPAYDSDAFAKVVTRVQHRLRVGTYVDETSQLSTWHIPEAHPFETWGVGYSPEGLLTIRQPLIDPIFGGLSHEEFLYFLAKDQRVKRLEILRVTLKGILSDSRFDEEFATLVHDGFAEAYRQPTVKPELRIATDVPQFKAPGNGLEVVFNLSSSTFDGRFANNGWLQETPAALTKLTWQNAALIAPSTATKWNVATGDVVRITVEDRVIEIPAFVLPGQAPNSIGIAIGYGRTAAGHVGGNLATGVKPVGVNVAHLRRNANAFIATEVKLETTGQRVTLATTQDHHAIDKVGLEELAGRIGELVREGTEQQFREHPDFAQHKVHHPPLESLWTERSPEGHAWGMSIDLSRCIGCNACMVACQSENNVPIVGADQVAKGREMHWIRVDRYFAGDIDNPQVVTQPVTCQHCENAPCEQVCPVAATVHSPEGLNDMAYNRCVGTRYCANNCPYKVRRFNFLDYTSQLADANAELARLMINPEVTVRSRGVMEKCTFCVQRIQTVKIDAKNHQRAIVDGEIQTACQQACPAAAIRFGDLLDQQSEVSRSHANPRSYAMLAELNVKPRTKYLARIRNPHPDLEKFNGIS